MFETTPNPNALKINMDHQLEVGMDYFESNNKNPDLVNKLVGVEGITSVFIGPNFLTVLKKHEYDWKDIKTTIEELL
jgi:hypothetical protein